MIIITWIVLILNILINLTTFGRIFTEKTILDRVANFIACTGAILACILSIYILRL